MAFKEDLQEAIRKAKSEKEQEESDRSDFDSRWENLRRTMILDCLKEAAAVIGPELGKSEARIDNGGVALRIKTDTEQTGYVMSFSPNREECKVTYSSSVIDDLEESFILSNLTKSVVEMKVKQFAYAIAREVGSSLKSIVW